MTGLAPSYDRQKKPKVQETQNSFQQSRQYAARIWEGIGLGASIVVGILLMLAGVPDVVSNRPSAAAAESYSPLFTPQGTDESERIETILLNHKAARQRIQTATFDQEWSLYEFDENRPVGDPLPGMRLAHGGQGTWTRDDYRWRIERETTRYLMGIEAHEQVRSGIAMALESGEAQLDETSWFVFNDDHYAFNPHTDLNRIYLTQHTDLEGSLDYVEQHLLPNALRFGFGVGAWYLDEEYFSKNHISEWHVEDIQTEHGPAVMLVRYMPTLDPEVKRRSEFVLDPNRDFLITRFSHNDANNVLRFELTVSLQQLPDGSWFPETIQRRKRDALFTLFVSNVSLNTAIDEDMFDISTCDWTPEVTRLDRRELDGTWTAMLSRDDQWIPMHILDGYETSQ